MAEVYNKIRSQTPEELKKRINYVKKFFISLYFICVCGLFLRIAVIFIDDDLINLIFSVVLSALFAIVIISIIP